MHMSKYIGKRFKDVIWLIMWCIMCKKIYEEYKMLYVFSFICCYPCVGVQYEREYWMVLLTILRHSLRLINVLNFTNA